MTDDDHGYRQIAADCMAHRYVLEILLARFLSELPAAEREGLADVIKQSSRSLNAILGGVRSEERSEFLADVLVTSQQKIDGLIDDAMARVRHSTP